jgi:hypothetical protein
MSFGRLGMFSVAVACGVSVAPEMSIGQPGMFSVSVAFEVIAGFLVPPTALYAAVEAATEGEPELAAAAQAER